MREIKSILIISYIFPPFPSVGGRRWMKFAKYLSKRGITLHILHVKNPLPETAPWVNEVEHVENVVLYPTLSGYPTRLFTKPRSVFQKFLYRFTAFVLSKLTNGHYFDWAVLWKNSMVKNAARIIRRNSIDTVVVTAPPFHSLHHALALKKMFPSIQLVSDFRDPWTENLEMQKILSKRLSHELRLEKSVLETSDIVLTVSDWMSERLKEKVAPEYRGKIHTVWNGFDPEDIPSPKTRTAQTSKKIRLIYAGELYGNIGHLVRPFVEAIEKIRTDTPSLFERLEIDFFGSQDNSYELTNIKCHPTIPRTELGVHIQQSDIALIFLPDHIDFAFSTKFVEYLAFRKPMFLISRYGSTARFVQENQLGYWLDPDRMLESFMDALQKQETYKQGDHQIHLIEEFSIPNLTTKLLDIFKTPSFL